MSAVAAPLPSFESPPLVSTHSSTWLAKFNELIDRIVQFIQRCLPFLFPQKEENPLALSPQIRQAIYRAKQQAAQQPSIGGFVWGAFKYAAQFKITEAALPLVNHYLWPKPAAWIGMIATQSLIGTAIGHGSFTIEYISDFSFPRMPRTLKKIGSLAISAFAIYKLANFAGYPQSKGKFFINISGQIAAHAGVPQGGIAVGSIVAQMLIPM